MGAWSDEIFGNDLACDVRDSYTEHRAAGDAPEIAMKHVRREFADALRESDEKWTVWIALAAAQAQDGSILEEVRDKALRGIAWCGHPDRDPEEHPFGVDALKALRERLGGPAPVPAKKPKPITLPGTAGDVVAVRFGHTDGEAVCVIGGPVGFDRGPNCGRVVLLPDLPVAKVTVQTVTAALAAWRQHYEVWPNMLGRGFGCYDVTAKLPARKTRKLLAGLNFPESFARRMQKTGAVYRAADMPYVIENDVQAWREREWAVDPKADDDA